MATAAYNIITKLQIQGPDNLGVVTRNIQNQLNGLKANIKINAPGLSGQVDKQLANIKNQVDSLTASARAGSKGVADLNKTVTSSADGLAKFAEQTGLATRRFLAFSAASAPIFAILNALKGGISNAISFQREMVRLAQVTTDAASSIQGVEREITDLSTSLGVSSAELAKASVTFKQAGFNAQQLSEALRTVALTDLSPTFDSIEKTGEAIIAASSQFKIASRDYVGAFGSINAVAAQFAVESADVSEAIKKAGGAFAVSAGQLTQPREALNQFIALFTSIRSTTREGASEIATGLRTIFARVQRSTTGDALRQLGIDLRFTQKEAEALGNINLTGQFVGAYEAVNRLSQALANIPSTDARFSAIVEELGGVRQISRVIPLIQQFSTAQQALVVAQSGQISLTLAAEKAQEAFAVKLSKVREEFLALGRALFASNGFQAFAQGALSAASALGEVLRFIGPIIQPLTILAGIKFAQNALPALGSFAQSFTGSRRPARGFNTGGPVFGSGTGDTVNARLEPGEFVLKKDASQSIGVNALNYMNKTGRIPPGFALGGLFPEKNIIAGPQLGTGNVSEKIAAELQKLIAQFGESIVAELSQARALSLKGPGGLKDLTPLGFGSKLSDRPSSANGGGATTIDSVLAQIVNQQGLKSPQEFFGKVGGGAARALKLSGFEAEEVSSQAPSVVTNLIKDLISQKKTQDDIVQTITAKKNNPVFEQLGQFSESFTGRQAKFNTVSFDETKGSGEDDSENNFANKNFTNRTGGFIDVIRRISGQDFIDKQLKQLDKVENRQRLPDGTLKRRTDAERAILEGEGGGDYQGLIDELRRLGIEPKDTTRAGVAKEYFNFIEQEANANGGLGNFKGKSAPFDFATLPQFNNQLNKTAVGFESSVLDLPFRTSNISGLPPGKVNDFIERSRFGGGSIPPSPPVLPSPAQPDPERQGREILLSFNDILETTTKNAALARQNIQNEATAEERQAFASGRTLARVNERSEFIDFIPKTPDFSRGQFPGTSSARVNVVPPGFNGPQAALSGQFGIGDLNKIASTTESKEIRDLIRSIILQEATPDNLAQQDNFQSGATSAIIRNNKLQGFTLPEARQELPLLPRQDSDFQPFQPINVQARLRSEAIKDSTEDLTKRFGTTGVSEETQAASFNSALAKRKDTLFEQIIEKEIELLQAISERVNGVRLSNQEAEKLAVERARAGDISQTIRGDIASSQTLREAVASGVPTGNGPAQPGFFGRQRDRAASLLGRVGSGLSSGLNFVRDNKASRFLDRGAGVGQALVFGAPLLADQFFGQDRTADEAIGSAGASREFTRNRGANNAVQGGIATGLIAGAFLGPLGAAVGGVVGAFKSLISGTKDAEQELRQARIGKAVGEFSDRLGTILASNGNASSVNSSVALQKIDEAITEGTARNRVTAGDDANQFIELQRKSLRDNFGQQIPQITQLLNKTAEDLAKANLGAKVSDLATRLGDGSNKLSSKLLELLDSLGVGEGIREQLKKTISITQGQEGARRGAESNANLQETRVATFGRLVTAIEAASDSLFALQSRSTALADAFSGTFGAQNLRLGPDVKEFGSQNTGLLNTIAGTGGSAGGELRDYASVLAIVEQRLPSVITTALAGSGQENFDFGTTVGIQLREALGGKNASDIALEAIRTIQSQITQLSGGEEGPGRVLTQSRDNLLSFSKDLTSTFSAQIRETQNSFKARLEEGLNGYAAALAGARQRELQILTEREKLAELVTKREENLVRETASARGVAPGLISRQTFEGPLRTRQEGLTGLRGEASFNLNAVGNRYIDSLNEYSEAQKRLAEGIKQGADAKALLELQKGFDAAQGNLDRFGRALKNLTDTASRTAFAQQRLGELAREEDSRRGFAEKLATADVGELANINRSSVLLSRAVEQGSVRGFSGEDRRSILELLRSLGGATLTGVGGGDQRADEIFNRFIKEFTGIGLTTGQKGERDALNQELRQIYADAERAQNLLVTELGTTNKELKDNIASQNESFLAKLGQVLTQGQRLDLQGRIASATGARTEAFSNLEQAQKLRGLGVNNQADLDRLRGVAPQLSDLATANIDKNKFFGNLRNVRETDLGFDANSFKSNTGTAAVIAVEVSDLLRDKIIATLDKNDFGGSANEVIAGFRQNLQENLSQNKNLTKEQIGQVVNRSFLQSLQTPSITNRGIGVINKVNELESGITAKVPGLDISKIFPDNNFAQRFAELDGFLKKFDGAKLNIDKLAQSATDAEQALNRLTVQLNGLGVLAPEGRYNGGRIGGTDKIPAMLTRGEFVVNASASSNNLPLLNDINKGRTGFANGGEVNLDAILRRTPGTLSNLRRQAEQFALRERERINQILIQSTLESSLAKTNVPAEGNFGIKDDYIQAGVRSNARIRQGNALRNRLPGGANIDDRVNAEVASRSSAFFDRASLSANVGGFASSGRFANSQFLDEGQKRIFGGISERNRNQVSARADLNSQFIRQDVLDGLKQIPVKMEAAFVKFNDGVAKMAEAIGQFPSEINLNGRQTVEVVFNGAEVFSNLTTDLKKMIDEEIKIAVNKIFKEQLPDANVNII
jgi:TP901 family phage tail tape measure protein